MNLKSVNYLLTCIVLILILLQIRSCQKSNNLSQINQSINDSLEKTTDHLGRETSSKLVIVGELTDLKNLGKTKDSMLNALIDKVSKQTITITMLENQTNTHHGTPTTVDTTHGTNVVVGDTVFVYPNYSSSYSDRFEKYAIKATKDTTYLDHQTFNYFTIQQKYVRNGLFKPKSIELVITNENPKTITVNAQSFLIKPKKENRLLWVGGSFLAGMVVQAVLYTKQSP